MFDRMADRIPGSYPHLFGPAIVIALVAALSALLAFVARGAPDHPAMDLDWAKVSPNLSKEQLTKVFDYQLADYKEGLSRLEANFAFQALLIATGVLVIVRRADSLNFLGNSVPLRWFHFFIPILLTYLWLNSGFIEHGLVWGRIRGAVISEAIYGEEIYDYKRLFRDGGLMDGWFILFVDPDSARFSGVKREFSTGIFLTLPAGLLFSANFATAMSVVAIGWRRYSESNRRLLRVGYYALPLIPMLFFVVSNLQFMYGGPNRNSFQLFVAAATPIFMAVLLVLSVIIDRKSYPASLRAIRAGGSDG